MATDNSKNNNLQAHVTCTANSFLNMKSAEGLLTLEGNKIAFKDDNGENSFELPLLDVKLFSQKIYRQAFPTWYIKTKQGNKRYDFFFNLPAKDTTDDEKDFKVWKTALTQRGVHATSGWKYITIMIVILALALIAMRYLIK